MSLTASQLFSQLAQYARVLGSVVSLPKLQEQDARVGTAQGFEALANLPIVATVTYSASMAPDTTLGGSQRITPTDGVGFTINDPTPQVSGNVISITIINTFGVLGAATFGANIKLGAAWTQPANGFRRTIQLESDGTKWHEVGRTAADVAN